MLGGNEQLFVRVVEMGSLKAAADEIGANPSAISRRIAALEKRLGARLIQRSTKGSRPTEAGLCYYEGMRRLIDAQAALEEDVAGLVDHPKGQLRVTAPVDFGARFVVPVLADFQNEASGLMIDLYLGSGFTNLVEEGIDVAIRVGELPASNMTIKRLGAVRRAIVASRDYLERYAAPVSPSDLEKHPFIFYHPGQRELSFDIKIDNNAERITVRGTFTANNITAIRKLISLGHGLHLGPVWAFEQELADGSFVQLLPDYSLQAFPLHALYKPTPLVPAKLRQFIDRMAKAVEMEPSLHE